MAKLRFGASVRRAWLSETFAIRQYHSRDGIGWQHKPKKTSFR